MKKALLTLFFPSLIMHCIHAQSILEADGPGDTYELITSVLAPGDEMLSDPVKVIKR